ncbi:MAG: hypothetical protein Kow0031_29980 [Anaerolineae bacterium]
MAEQATQPTSPHSSLEQAIALARGGQKTQASEVLREVVAREPGNQAAWLWLSAVADDRSQAEAALAQARKINPQHHALNRAEQWLARRFADQPDTRQNQPTRVTAAAGKPPVDEPPSAPVEPPPEPEPTPALNEPVRAFGSLNAFAVGLAVVVIVIGLIVLFFGLVFEVSGSALASGPALDATEVQRLEPLQAQLTQAQARHDWPAAIAALTEMRRLAPDSADTARLLADALAQNGYSLRNRGFVADAVPQFEQSLALHPEQPALQTELQLARAYVAGADFYQRGQWPEAIARLEQIWQQDKNYINVRDLLYSAQYNHALSQQAAGQFAAAKVALEAATTLRPDLSEPRRLLAELNYELAPRTPAKLSSTSLEDRLILVGIAEQRMLVYDGDDIVFDFVVSTGEPGSDTAVGEFEILNKIDVAYGSSWNLDMPYWMGIYWAGPLQNGIHALPIVKHTGYKLWDGYLGQRVSYGCIILGDEDAATLYEWTEVGTKIKIVPSLESYLAEQE